MSGSDEPGKGRAQDGNGKAVFRKRHTITTEGHAEQAAALAPSRGLHGATVSAMKTTPPPLRALTALLAFLAGCASGTAPGHFDEGQAPGWLPEDAGPTYYEEHEVDVPARPAAPIRPDYPPRLRALGVEGDVEARVVVLHDGSVAGARLLESTHDDFTIAVHDALREARFHPALLRGEAVSSWLTVRLHFRLEK